MDGSIKDDPALRELIREEKARAAREKVLDDVNDKIQRALIDLRIKRGVTQVELAKIVGTSQSALSRMEKGEGHKARLSTILKVADALDVDLVIEFKPRGEDMEYQGAGQGYRIEGCRASTGKNIREDDTGVKYQAGKKKKKG